MLELPNKTIWEHGDENVKRQELAERGYVHKQGAGSQQ